MAGHCRTIIDLREPSASCGIVVGSSRRSGKHSTSFYQRKITSADLHGTNRVRNDHHI